MSSESSFEIDGDLIILEAIVVGPSGKRSRGSSSTPV